MKRLALIALLACGAASAQDATTQLAQRCFACHGPNGAKPILPEYPVIAGQYANYLEKALNEYREGKRKNPVMGAQAAQLSAQDVHALAEFFGSQAGPLYTPTEEGKTQ